MAIKCKFCNGRLLTHSLALKCYFCEGQYHLKCIPSVTRADSLYVDKQTNRWLCISCSSEIFPFNHNTNDREFLQNISEMWYSRKYIPYLNLDQYVFNPFEWNDDNPNLPNLDSDPDLQYFNDMTYANNINNCNYYLEDDFGKKISNFRCAEKCFSLTHLNIRSIPKNLEYWNLFLKSLNYEFTVIGISETWLTENNVNCFDIDGYQHEYLFRSSGKRGGGVSLFIKDTIEYFVRNDLSRMEDCLECLFIEVPGNQTGLGKNCVLGTIYRPPNTSIQTFNEKISEILHTVKSENKYIYLMGDFNIDLIQTDTHLPTSDFLEIMYSFGLFSLISKPTRVKGESATLIDNIFTNNILNCETINGIFFVEISDHFPVFSLNLTTQVKERSGPDFQIRDYSKVNVDKFQRQLQTLDWSDVIHCQDGLLAFELFYERYNMIYNGCFPIKSLKTGYLTKRSWLTDGLKKSIKMKNKLYLKMLKNKTEETIAKYRNYKSKLRKLLRITERKHYEQLIKENKCNSKKMWAIIKDVITKKRGNKIQSKFRIGNSEITNKNRIANHFNNYFVNIGKELDRAIPDASVDPIDYINFNCLPSIAITSTDQNEVSKIVMSLKNTSPGCDGIHSKILKQTFPLYSRVLTHVLNLSLLQGIFPKSMKIARVIPLYKAGDHMQISNYRPVSILPLFSKVLEKLMYNRLLNYINEYDILHKYQFGFREKHNTNMALITLVDNITTAIDQGELVLGVFLDFRKAFDTVNHQILLRKLYKYGIRGIAYKWIQDYLTQRHQFVSFNNVNSESKQITCGVPQGSVLGPLLFLLYINDLMNVSDLLFSILFADDTNLFLRGKAVDETILLFNLELEKVVEWLKANRLSLNLDKTHFMVFTSSRRSIIQLQDLKIDGRNIKYVDNTKFIGVILDSKLKWDKHITMLKSKLSRGMGILSKARKTLAVPTLITLYYSFIYPHFLYCIEVWGKAADVYMNSLAVMQKRILRVMSSSSFRASTSPIYKKFEILKLEDIYRFVIIQFVFKYVKGLLPSVFDNMFTRNVAISARQTRQSFNLRVPLCRTNIRKFTVRFQGVKEWNDIVRHLDIFCSLYTFKIHLKKHLLKSST